MWPSEPSAQEPRLRCTVPGAISQTDLARTTPQRGYDPGQQAATTRTPIRGFRQPVRASSSVVKLILPTLHSLLLRSCAGSPSLVPVHCALVIGAGISLDTLPLAHRVHSSQDPRALCARRQRPLRDGQRETVTAKLQLSPCAALHVSRRNSLPVPVRRAQPVFALCLTARAALFAAARLQPPSDAI